MQDLDQIKHHIPPSQTSYGASSASILEKSYSFARGLIVYNRPGAHFTNDFLPAIQIRWKLRLAEILLLAIRSKQIFAHATTAQLSCHVQNFCSDHCIRIEMRVKRYFHRIWIAMEKPLVKRGPASLHSCVHNKTKYMWYRWLCARQQ